MPRSAKWSLLSVTFPANVAVKGLTVLSILEAPASTSDPEASSYSFAAIFHFFSQYNNTLYVTTAFSSQFLVHNNQNVLRNRPYWFL